MVRLAKARVSERKGFTLIELIVVIAIIAILALILVPRFSGYADRARENAAMSDTRNIIMAVQVGLTEGKTSINLTDIEEVLGVALKGKIGNYNESTVTGQTLASSEIPDTFSLEEASFIYYYPVSNDVYYAVVVEDGVISEKEDI